MLKCIEDVQILKYNKSCISYSSINLFDDDYPEQKRNKNDINNKVRENMIAAIINDKIPVEYYKYSIKWSRLKSEIFKFLHCLGYKEIPKRNVKFKCISKAGRKNNHDFEIFKTTDTDCKKYNIEFKFNCEILKNTPQFISATNPSRFLETRYEEYYYDNYLYLLAIKFNLKLPEKSKYLNEIHSTNPKCMVEYQKRYYNGCKKSSKYTNLKEDIDFYEFSKEISKKSIIKFIENNHLDIQKLTEYLKETQKDKIYMLYKNKSIKLLTLSDDEYQITSYIKKPNLQKYIAFTKSGNSLNILLRWKNGNGIAYPAFQVSF